MSKTCGKCRFFITSKSVCSWTDGYDQKSRIPIAYGKRPSTDKDRYATDCRCFEPSYYKCGECRHFWKDEVGTAGTCDVHVDHSSMPWIIVAKPRIDETTCSKCECYELRSGVALKTPVPSTKGACAGDCSHCTNAECVKDFKRG